MRRSVAIVEIFRARENPLMAETHRVQPPSRSARRKASNSALSGAQ